MLYSHANSDEKVKMYLCAAMNMRCKKEIVNIMAFLFDVDKMFFICKQIKESIQKDIYIENR